MAAGLDAAGTLVQERRDFAGPRQAVIAANPELQERELIKLASLASAMADALRARGVGESAARLVAEAGIAAFRLGFERWIGQPKRRDLPGLIRESLDELRTALSAG
jgi:hypothetical protein